MKRFVDISHIVTPDLFHDLSLLTRHLSVEDLASLPQSIAGSTYVYIPDGKEKITPIDSVFAGRFFSRAWQVNVETVPGDVMTCDILGDMEDMFEPGDSLLIKSGWYKRHGDKASYFDKYPVVGLDLVEWLIRKQGNMLITDTPFLSNVNYIPEFSEIYDNIAQSNMMVVSGVTNLDILQDARFDIVAMPIKIAGLNFAPVRAIAMLE